MRDSTTYVGLDVHKKKIVGATLYPGESTPEIWTVANEKALVQRMIRRIGRRAPGLLACCYEAGSCGFTVQRWVRALGEVCVVIAPSMTPRRPGDRVRTDRRDARKLVEYFRWGMLNEVEPPTREEESVRALTRCREQVRSDLTRCRHRLTKFLDQRAKVYRAGSHWTSRHRQWLRRVELEQEADRRVLEEYLLAVEQLEERRKHLEEEIEAISRRAPYAKAVARIRCFRGFETVSAMVVVSELYAFMRFLHPRSLMAFLGLVPSESSSGDRRKQGGVTKMGNRHVRRILIEAAHHYRFPPRLGEKLKKRRSGQPPDALAWADKAMGRLHSRYRKLRRMGKHHNVAVAAIARELVGFLWATLQGTLPEAVDLREGGKA